MQNPKVILGFEIERRLPDGRVEIKSRNGQRQRIFMYTCVECRMELPEGLFSGSQTCNLCREAKRKKSIDQGYREFRSERLKSAQEPFQRRRQIAILAKPAWRDLAAIRKIYKEARDKTKATGIQHHVDHYYPLQGDWCCGLHVHQNLRVLPFDQNCSKNNGHPMENSPALQAALDELGVDGLAVEKTLMMRRVSKTLADQ